MLSKYLLPLAFLISNLVLYCCLMALQDQPDLLLFFRIIRVALITSVVMQVLMAVGFVKPPQFK